MIIETSIITPMYNSEKEIVDTINSVLSQSYKHWELILIDDCSSDRTIEVVNKFATLDKRIKLLRLEKNSGAAVARNMGIEHSQGRYIAFLDSDDNWSTNKLTKQVDFMKRNNYKFTYTAYNKVNEQGVLLNKVGVPNRVDYFQLLKTNVIGCFTVIYDTDFFGKVFMPEIRKRQDFGLWLRLLKKVEFAYGLNECLGEYKVRSNSVSSNKLNTATYNWKLYREIENLSFIRSCYYFTHYALKGVIRTKFPVFAAKIGWIKSQNYES
ncbi:glycosyltransferase family 2 protein [Kangiella sp. TOML190]|uniref:glycosyltransferase family 2 protein n=1 Tax=Kangiella sp. TOML190 TaxID=2931351 RepID=UPI00203B095D|nr:glycosyltransferase family 2 protein [Kangiella sp. TOML190]